MCKTEMSLSTFHVIFDFFDVHLNIIKTNDHWCLIVFLFFIKIQPNFSHFSYFHSRLINIPHRLRKNLGFTNLFFPASKLLILQLIANFGLFFFITVLRPIIRNYVMAFCECSCWKCDFIYQSSICNYDVPCIGSDSYRIEIIDDACELETNTWHMIKYLLQTTFESHVLHNTDPDDVCLASIRPRECTSDQFQYTAKGYPHQTSSRHDRDCFPGILYQKRI